MCIAFIDEETDKVEEEWLLNFTSSSTPESCMQPGRDLSKHAEVTLSMTGDVFEKLLFGKISPEFAYLRRMYKVKGDPKAGLKMKYLITKVRSMGC